jgi:ribosomal protein S18 acetylase RimI-like enzyme
MMRFAIEEARAKGARTVQLMSNSRRTEAHRFYERLGFSRSHAGFKIKLE